MSERARIEAALVAALRPLIVEVVREELERQQPERTPPAEQSPYLTVGQYARVHHASPAAVRARIRRGTLAAIRPPGSRQYLLPSGGDRSDGGGLQA